MSSEKDLASRDLCFIDVETSGVVFGYHEIVDIAGVRTTPDATTIRGKWQRRVKPKHPERFSSYARELNGYTPKRWTNAKQLSKDFWNEFVAFVDGCVPVGHNPSFDRAFITLTAAEYDVLELGLDYHWIGTESLAWPFHKKGVLPDLSLESICDVFGIEPEPSVHSALEGALVCRRVYQVLMRQMVALESP